MCKITVAKSAGFCFGVKRAVEMVYEEAEKGGKIYTFGPIIHNEEVVNDLKKRGMSFVGSTIIYSYLQAIGIIYSHENNCYLYKKGD